MSLKLARALRENIHIGKDSLVRCLRLPYFKEWLKRQVLGLGIQRRSQKPTLLERPEKGESSGVAFNVLGPFC